MFKKHTHTHKNHLAIFCMCACFYNPTPISWASNLNRQCPATGSVTQFDVDLHRASRFHDCQSGECQQFVCFSLFSSQTVIANCIPRCFLHFSKSTLATFFDVKKAYDNVWHARLLYKAEKRRNNWYDVPIH